jgi:16S rRNA (guanine1516-N2)-methyltransferase
MNLSSAKMMTVPLYCQQRRSELNQNLFNRLSEYEWIEVASKPPSQSFLMIDDGQLGLANAQYPKVLPVFVDFLHGASAHRRLHGGGAGQAVAKAVGLNKRKDLSILDATAGLGRDAFVMASLGAQVTMYERNNVVYEILKDGLDRMSLSADHDILDILQRMKLEQKSLIESYPSEKAQPGFDVVYLDPMFPERGKSAKVKKDMSMFHDVVGSDVDADSLLAPALELAKFRVVVKRSKSAPNLAGQKPTTTLVGKSSRFDLYTKKAINPGNVALLR